MFTGGSHYKKRATANRNSGRRNDKTSRASNLDVSI